MDQETKATYDALLLSSLVELLRRQLPEHLQPAHVGPLAARIAEEATRERRSALARLAAGEAGSTAARELGAGQRAPEPARGEEF